jgi:hypothetical protein
MSLTEGEMLAIFDREVRQQCEWTRMRRDVLPNVVRYVKTGVGVGGGDVSWSNLTAETADAAIESQVEFFKALGVDFEWKLYSHDQPADLGERLIAHGFKPDDPEALMVIEIASLPPDFWTMDISPVTRITTPEGVDAIVRMENEVWGSDLSRIGDGLKYDLEHSPDHVSVFAIWDGDRVVSAAWTFYLVPTSFATLWGGSTLKEFRNKGYYSMLLAARAREACSRWYRFLQVDASPDSQPILAKNGFKCLAYSTPYDWDPQSAEGM